MRTDVRKTTPESLASKSFRSSSTNDDHPQLEVSEFGVRVPGGAQKPRSRKRPGLLHVCYDPFTSLFAATPLPPELQLLTSALSGGQARHPSELDLIVTMRHITSLRIVPTSSDPLRSQALSNQASHRLEA